eukprot:g1235.t1
MSWRSTRSLPDGCYKVSPKADQKISSFLRGDLGEGCGTAVLHLDELVNKLDPAELGYLLMTILTQRVAVQVAFLQGALPFQSSEACFEQLLQLLRGRDAEVDAALPAAGTVPGSPGRRAASYVSSVWSVNLGELKFSEAQLDRLCAALRHPRCGVTHLFFECTNLPDGRKAEMRGIIRDNRGKHDRWRLGSNEAQNAVVFSCRKCWFNAVNHGCNKAWLEQRRKRHRIARAAEREAWVGDRVVINVGKAEDEGADEGVVDEGMDVDASGDGSAEDGAGSGGDAQEWYPAKVLRQLRPHVFVIEFENRTRGEVRLDRSTRNSTWRFALPEIGDLLRLRSPPGAAKGAAASDADEWDTQCLVRDKYSVRDDSGADPTAAGPSYMFSLDVLGAAGALVGSTNSSLSLETFRVDWWFEGGDKAETLIHEAQKQFCKRGVGCGTDDDAAWVQCDLCGKWRKLPVGLTDWPGSFTCANNPDRKHASCDRPDESVVGTQDDFQKGRKKAARKPRKTQAQQRGAAAKRLGPGGGARADAKRARRQAKDPGGDADGHGKLTLNWVQCQDCNKWRSLRKNMCAWPNRKRFTCAQNTWKPRYASCSAGEESYSDEDAEEDEGTDEDVDEGEKADSDDDDDESEDSSEMKSSAAAMATQRGCVARLLASKKQGEARLQALTSEDMSQYRSERRQIEYLARVDEARRQLARLTEAHMVGSAALESLVKAASSGGSGTARKAGSDKPGARRGRPRKVAARSAASRRPARMVPPEAKVVPPSPSPASPLSSPASSVKDAPDLSEFMYDGHKWLHRYIVRHIEGKIVHGRIFAWLPAQPEAGDQAFWRAVHEDGDVEDLEADEALVALSAHVRRLQEEHKETVVALSALRAIDPSKLAQRKQIQWFADVADAEKAEQVAATSLTVAHDLSVPSGHDSCVLQGMHGPLTEAASRRANCVIAALERSTDAVSPGALAATLVACCNSLKKHE